MTIYSIIFYLLALLILGSTAMAITRRNLIHAVIYLIFFKNQTKKLNFASFAVNPLWLYSINPRSRTFS